VHAQVDLNALRAQVPPDGILSRTIFNDDRVKAVWFGFAAGQELSEHTASMPAVIHILEGQARLTLGSEASDAGAGTWVHMPANLSHGVRAVTQVTMLLLLLKAPKA
jgi:quercetin dioxygenase-like cupin family protein